MTSTETPETAEPAPPTIARPRVRVWDVPTRLVHWLLVLLIPFSWWTAESGRLEWHRWSGYTLLGLVLFRLYWGFFGSSTARFSRFVRGPRVIAGYLRGAWQATAGHNPLGALSVLGLLGLLLAQVLLGLFAIDVDGIESGPLSARVSFAAGRAAAGWHEAVFNVLMVLVALHVVAVLYYAWFRRQSLVSAMVTGSRIHDTEVAPLVTASWPRLLIGVVSSAAVTWLVAKDFQF
jgi:cytochrome b